MTVNFYEEIVRDSFGLWISALFSAIGSRNSDLSFEQQKTSFFYMIEDLLDNGKIKFIKPGADCYISQDNPIPKMSINEAESHWNLESKKIVSYLKDKWPVNVISEDELELTAYFYEIPGVIWIDEDGRFIAS